MGAIDLAEDLAGVDEQDLVGPPGLALFPVEEPKRHRQRHGVEEVGADCDHNVDQPGFDQLAPDLALTVTGVRGRVGHHETGATGLA